MDVRTCYTETLACAAATIGGAERLARFLNVPHGRLLGWLAGEEAPPNQVFLDALDVIAVVDADADRLPRRLDWLQPTNAVSADVWWQSR